MKRKAISGRILAVLSTLTIFLISAITYVIFYITKYYLYYFLFATGLFLSATNGLFLILKAEDLRMARPRKVRIRKREKKRTYSLHSFVLPIVLIAYAFVFYYCCAGIIAHAKNITNDTKPTILHIVIFIVLFVVVTIFDRLCKHVEGQTSFVRAILSNCRTFFILLVLSQ